MNVNATLLLQIGNFFIVYSLLRLLLFKPVVAIIEQESLYESSLHNIIDQHKKSIEIQEKERLRHWHACQEYFIQNRPFISQNINQTTSFLSQEVECDINSNKIDSVAVDTIADMINKISNALEEKIKHVH